MAPALNKESRAGRSDTGRRALVRVRGIVQGVGFRPYIFQLAHHYGLGGWVSNQADGVEIVIAGATGEVEGFLRDLRVHPPPAFEDRGR